jgi:hypothetical protein
MTEVAEAVEAPVEEVAEVVEQPQEAPEVSEPTETPEVEEVAENAPEIKEGDPEGYKKTINKKHFAMKEAERRAEAAEKRMQELESKASAEPVLEAVEVPPIPDSYSDNFEAEMKARDEAIAANARYNEHAARQAAAEAESIETQRKAQEEYTRELNTTFEGNVSRLGLDQDKVNEAANMLVQYGADSETAKFVMTDEDGPLVAQYFAADLQAFDEFLSMSPMSRGMKMGEIKEASRALLPNRVNDTPAPATVVTGKTAPAQRGPSGATFK